MKEGIVGSSERNGKEVTELESSCESESVTMSSTSEEYIKESMKRQRSFSSESANAPVTKRGYVGLSEDNDKETVGVENSCNSDISSGSGKNKRDIHENSTKTHKAEDSAVSCSFLM